MNKKDLKSGMTVKTRNGNVYLVVNDFLTREQGYEPLRGYYENLKHLTLGDYDIVEVYQYQNPIWNNAQNLELLLEVTHLNMKLLWKRQELPKLTSAERVILENLDKKYKWITRDKDGDLRAQHNKPYKMGTLWCPNGLGYAALDFPKLFTFVKREDEQPYSIEELLKGEK